MTEPCPRCPPFVVRCGHLGEWAIRIAYYPSWEGWFGVAGPEKSAEPAMMDELVVISARAEADAEFDRREEALLG